MGEFGVAQVSIDARVSTSTLEKLMGGTYPNIPKIRIREDICRALNVPIEEIFMPVSAG